MLQVQLTIVERHACCDHFVRDVYLLTAAPALQGTPKYVCSALVLWSNDRRYLLQSFNTYIVSLACLTPGHQKPFFHEYHIAKQN